MLLWFLVIHVDKTLGIISERDAHFFKFEKQAQFSAPKS